MDDQPKTTTARPSATVSHETPKPPPTGNVPAKVDMKHVALRGAGAGGMINPKNLQEVVDFAQIMCRAGPAIPPVFQGQPGLCMAVTMQALRWEMDPFAVAQQAYVTPDKEGNLRLAYMAQLVASVVNLRGPFTNRPFLEFDGVGDKMVCTVSATIRGETIPRKVKSPTVASIHPKFSPLWKSDTEQQLAYYTLRSFARRTCPEVLLGVYTSEEVGDMESLPGAVTILPPDAKTSATEPKPSQFRGDRGTPADGLKVQDPEAQAEAEAEADRMMRRVQEGLDPEPTEFEEGDQAQPDVEPDVGQEAQGSVVTAEDDHGPDVTAQDGAPADDQDAGQDDENSAEAKNPELEAAIEAERKAIEFLDGTVNRAIAGLEEWRTVDELRDYVRRMKMTIDGAAAPAIERGKARGRFVTAALERERAMSFRAPARRR